MQVRTLLAGIVVAVAASALTLVGGTLGITEVWPMLLVVGAGLLVGVPRLAHGLALATGIVGGSATVAVAVAVLPATPLGRAIATASGLLLLTAVTLASRGRLRLSLQLVGWAAAASTWPEGPSPSLRGASLLAEVLSDAVTLLIAAALGLLVAQVTQLVGTGSLRRPGGRGDDRQDGGSGGTAAVLIATLVLVASGAATGTATAQTAGTPSGDPANLASVVEHRQTLVRTHAADGTVTSGSVVTRLTASGAGPLRVTLRDQAVRDLRSLTGLALGLGPVEAAAPEVDGTTVTQELDPGATVRSVATLDRALPVALHVEVTLDGEATTAAEVVGRSGRLEVTYTLTNLTSVPRELRFFDGAGRPRTTTREVAVPLVGDLVVTLDDRFGVVSSTDAVVTDGEVRASVVLAPPTGAAVRTIRWSADVVDAALPPVRVRLVPLALGATAGAGVDVVDLEATSELLRAVSDAAGLARTGAAAFVDVASGTASPSDDDLSASTVVILEGLLADVAEAGAAYDEVRALVAAQDARVRAGEGRVHGLLDAADVVPAGTSPSVGSGAVRVEASVAYVLDVAGRDAAPQAGTLLRALLALLLLAAVGLLGRAIGHLTTATRPDGPSADAT